MQNLCNRIQVNLAMHTLHLVSLSWERVKLDGSFDLYFYLLPFLWNCRNGDAAPCALDQWKTLMFHLKSRSCRQTCMSSEEMLRNYLQTNNCFKAPQETPTRKIDKYATDSNVSKDCIIMTNRRKKIMNIGDDSIARIQTLIHTCALFLLKP